MEMYRLHFVRMPAIAAICPNTHIPRNRKVLLSFDVVAKRTSVNPVKPATVFDVQQQTLKLANLLLDDSDSDSDDDEAMVRVRQIVEQIRRRSL